MTLLRRFHILARYNVLTPVALLGAVALALPAVAATIVVNAPDTDGVELTVTDNALENNSAISNGPGNTVVWSHDPVDFIHNNVGASITGDGDSAVDMDGTVNSFDNAGDISNGGSHAAIYFNMLVTEFTNSGRIWSSSSNAVTFDMGVGTFTNAAGGQIWTTANTHALSFNGPVQKFTNAGTISGEETAAAFNATVGEFTNSGVMTGKGWQAVRFEAVNTFTNTANGWIENLDGLGNAGDGAEFNGDIASFTNHGTIKGHAGSNSNGVGIYGGPHQIGTMENTGNVSGKSHGFDINGNVAAFLNSGTISSVDNSGVQIGGTVGSFSNSGTISSSNGNGVSLDGFTTAFENTGTLSGGPSNSGIYFDAGFGAGSNSGTLIGGGNGIDVNNGAAVTSFTNTATGVIHGETFAGARFSGHVGSLSNAGTISSAGDHALSISGGVDTFINSGTIITTVTGVDRAAVRVGGPGGTFVNSGTISGRTGFAAGLDASSSLTLTNSGTIIGDAGNAAIAFDWGPDDSDDTLVILTGSEIFGRIQMGNGDDIFDFSGFTGNTVLEVTDLETLVPGERMYVQDGDEIAIIDGGGATAVGNAVAAGVATELNNVIANQINGVGGNLIRETPLAYAPVSETEAEAAVLSALDTGGGSENTAWATAFGGGSRDSAPVDLASVYGGIVAGTHTLLMEGTTLGVLGGVVTGRLEVANGIQNIDTLTGVAGLYGKQETGLLDIDFSLLAGINGHDSRRGIIVLGATETATAAFTSWFVAPSVGLSLPVVSSADGEMNVATRLTYIGGGVSGYTETSPSLSIGVGAAPISLLDARIELNGSKVAGLTEHGEVTVHGKVGLLAQSNLGGSSVPFTFFGGGGTHVTPGAVAFGAYAGAGLDAPIAENVALNVGFDISGLTDGMLAGSGSIGIKGSY